MAIGAPALGMVRGLRYTLNSPALWYGEVLILTPFSPAYSSAILSFTDPVGAAFGRKVMCQKRIVFSQFRELNYMREQEQARWDYSSRGTVDWLSHLL